MAMNIIYNILYIIYIIYTFLVSMSLYQACRQCLWPSFICSSPDMLDFFHLLFVVRWDVISASVDTHLYSSERVYFVSLLKVLAGQYNVQWPLVLF